MQDLLILNDLEPENSIGGQATFIKNILPYLGRYYETELLTLPKFYLQINFIPRRLLYLLYLVSMTGRIKKATLIFSHTSEASYYVSFINSSSLFHIFHGNTNPVTTSRFWYGRYFRFIFDHFDRKIIRNANTCFTVGENRAQTIKINQPIDRCIIDNIPDCLIRKDFLFVGRLEEVKQINRIIRVFYKFILENIHSIDNLMICGEGIKESELRKLVAELNIQKRVIFTGKCEYDEVIRLMKSSKILLMASLYEGFPMVIAESLCCGLPVISTDVGSITDTISSGYNGYVLKKDFSETEYCECMKSILATPGEFRANAFKSARHFNAEYLVTHVLTSYFNQINTKDSVK